MSDRQQLRDILVGLLERGGFADRPLPTGKNALVRVTETADNDYDRLNAALALAARGDARAIPTLRRVFDEPWFALTNSCHEYGYAAVALALLDDVDSIDRIRGAPRANLAGPYCDLAVRVLAGPK